MFTCLLVYFSLLPSLSLEKGLVSAAGDGGESRSGMPLYGGVARRRLREGQQ